MTRLLLREQFDLDWVHTVCHIHVGNLSKLTDEKADDISHELLEMVNFIFENSCHDRAKH